VHVKDDVPTMRQMPNTVGGRDCVTGDRVPMIRTVPLGAKRIRSVKIVSCPNDGDE